MADTPTEAIVDRGHAAVQALIDMPVGDRSPQFLINRKEALTLLETYRRDIERLSSAPQEPDDDALENDIRFFDSIANHEQRHQRLHGRSPDGCPRHPSGHDQRRGIMVGDRVEKVSGYRWPGVIVAEFNTLAGKKRVVVECDAPDVAGALHIYNPEQIRKIGP